MMWWRVRAVAVTPKITGHRATPDPLPPVAPDRLTGHQHVVFVETGQDHLQQLQDIVAPAGRQVRGEPSGADEVVVHAQAGDLSLIHISEPTRPY